MPDFRSRRPNNDVNRPAFGSYEVVRDKGAGFKVKLNWEYQNAKVVGFRIYKASVSKSLLQRSYNISQRALERTTPIRTSRVQQLKFLKS